ncbi:uncharacterized protein LOC131148997 isoform X2 [Malania oleifera]|uniref:uncharacterized protein LOC131148997 isoform X2 n=1 Tax=Malania oleifera TaxID=397392 RepID=UPI0025ADE26E|nr:uncharacterized protein LOC131148997 isoform X2 [Malania oleifera]
MSAFCSSETVIFYFVLGTEHCRTGRPVAMLALATCASTPTATAVSFGGVPAHHIFKAPLGLVGSSNCSLLRSHRLTITTVTATAKTVGINSVDPAVAALDSEALNSTYPAGKRSAHKKYYFVVANATFMLDEEEHFKELLFERLRNYRERSKEQDFWLVIEPKFLNKFPDITRRLRRPAVALVSTNGPWITR